MLVGRIVGLDFGLKRTGIAVSDELQIIAGALDTLPTDKVLDFLKKYCLDHHVQTIVVGMPLSLKGQATHSTSSVLQFVETLKATFPQIPIHTYDERFTSKIASDAMIAAGMSKKYRQNKSNLDKASAAIILQDYLNFKK